MRRLLLTGGAGFFGGNFVHFWLRRHRGDAVVVLDALTYAGHRATLAGAEADPRFHFVHGDVTASAVVAEVMTRHAPDTVVHFAAETHVDRSIVDPGRFVRTNVQGNQVLLDAACRAWRTGERWRDGVRFHQVSTDEVYGSLAAHDPPVREGAPYAPASPYAASKAAADHLVRAFAHTFGPPATISICTNNHGPFQVPEKLIPLAIVRALQGGDVPICGDGRQERDSLHVDDHCRALECMLGAASAGRAYHVAGGAGRENAALVRTLCRLLDARFAARPELRARLPACPASAGGRCEELMRHVADRPGHDRRYALHTGRIASELGFTTGLTLQSGLERTVDWYLGQEAWWRGVVADWPGPCLTTRPPRGMRSLAASACSC